MSNPLIGSLMLRAQSRAKMGAARLKRAFGIGTADARDLAIRDAPWRAITVPPEAIAVETMLSLEERKLLYWLGSKWFRNEGVIVDAGCFLGGSTVALAEGVKANPAWRTDPREKLIKSYDLFETEAWTVGVYFPKGTEALSSFQAYYERNIEPISDLVEVNPGDVTLRPAPDQPIEVLFIDLAKHWTVSDYMTYHYFPRLQPGRSVVVQQDYLFTSWNCWLLATMEYYSDYFEMVGNTGVNSVVFLYTKQIPDEMLRPDLIGSMSRSRFTELTDRAIARFDGSQRDILLKTKAQFETVMDEFNWPR